MTCLEKETLFMFGLSYTASDFQWLHQEYYLCAVQRNETVFSHFTYNITYDITIYDIIVGIMMSLVICDA